MWSSDGVEVAVLLVSLLPISNVHLGGGGLVHRVVLSMQLSERLSHTLVYVQCSK